MLNIPKDRKRVSVAKLCLLMGLTALLFLLIVSSFGDPIDVLQPPPAG